MVAIASIVAIALAAQVGDPTVHGGRFRGVVADVTGASVSGALIKVLQPGSNLLLARAKTDQSGAFQTGVLNPGSYTLTAWVQGFRARAWSAVIVRSGEVTDLGTIPLDIAGCDAPGVNCDSIDPSPPRNPIVASGYLTVRLNCGADLAKSSVYCLDDATSRRQERTADLRATRSDAGIYLAPVNGTAMSALNPSRQDCSGGNQKPDRIRLDGLGPGNDLCVRTRDGRMSHVFLVNDVEPDSLEIQLWYVTRKR